MYVLPARPKQLEVKDDFFLIIIVSSTLLGSTVHMLYIQLKLDNLWLID